MPHRCSRNTFPSRSPPTKRSRACRSSYLVTPPTLRNCHSVRFSTLDFGSRSRPKKTGPSADKKPPIMQSSSASAPTSIGRTRNRASLPSYANSPFSTPPPLLPSVPLSRAANPPRRIRQSKLYDARSSTSSSPRRSSTSSRPRNCSRGMLCSRRVSRRCIGCLSDAEPRRVSPRVVFVLTPGQQLDYFSFPFEMHVVVVPYFC